MPNTIPANRKFWHKFRDAFRGLALGMRGQTSFVVHVICAVLVVAAAAWFRVTMVEWGLLVLCITAVMTAEMFNSSLEYLAKAVDQQYNAHIHAALDVASAAVLLAAIGASVVGLLVFLPYALATWQQLTH